MKLGDLFTGSSASGGAFRAPTKPVKFKVVGKDNRSEQVVADAEAVFVFVPQDERELALADAEKAIRKLYPDGLISPDRLLERQTIHILALALRDVEDARQPFATADELSGALLSHVRRDLYDQYVDFCDAEFPLHPDTETFDALIEDAKKKSVPDLLSAYGSSTMKRAWPSLVDHFGSNPTPTSSAGEPG